MTRRVVSDLLVQNFPENRVKFVLHNPGNLQDLACMLAVRYKLTLATSYPGVAATVFLEIQIAAQCILDWG